MMRKFNKIILIFLLMLFVLSSFLSSAQNTSINKINLTGVGSSFISPIMSNWAKSYYLETGSKVNYQSTGSGSGINMFENGAADFAATEIPITIDQAKQKNWKVFPITASGVVPVANIPGIKNNQLLLNGQVLADIFMGNIKYWDSGAIKSLNPKLILPHKKIIIVHRIGMSGTTYIFTSYLSQISVSWQQNLGANSTVNWPKDSLGGRENAGTATYIKQIPYSIGYIDYTYIKDDQINCIKLINKSGNAVEANLKTFTSAVKNHTWTQSVPIINESGKGSWPIVAVTFIIEKNNIDISEIKNFFKYIISSDELLKKAHKMGYIVCNEVNYLQ
jgi:phosphate transport system substrate-binding protein